MPSLKACQDKQNKPDTKQWVVVQLSSSAEKEKNLSVFQRSVKRYLNKDLDVFIPATNSSARDDNSVMYYMDGYVFIEYVTGVNYNKLNDTVYFSLVLTHPKTGVCLISDSEINVMRKGVEDLKVGKFSKDDEIKVIKGSFKNLSGRVVEVYGTGEFVQIDVGLLSKPMLIDYPANYLTKMS